MRHDDPTEADVLALGRVAWAAINVSLFVHARMHRLFIHQEKLCHGGRPFDDRCKRTAKVRIDRREFAHDFTSLRCTRLTG